MTTRPAMVSLLDQPDGTVRAAKGTWRTVRTELRDGIRAALIRMDVATPRVRLIGDLDEVATALSRDLGVSVGVSDTDVGAPAHTGDHVVGLLLPSPATAGDRLALLRAAMRCVGSTGQLVIAATVVSATGVPANRRPPSMSQLFEELDLASGARLQIDDLRSIRWGREPHRRGVLLTVTALLPPRGW